MTNVSITDDYVRVHREVTNHASSTGAMLALNITKNRQISDVERKMLLTHLVGLALEFQAFAALLVGDKAKVGVVMSATTPPNRTDNLSQLKEAFDGYEHNPSPPDL